MTVADMVYEQVKLLPDPLSRENGLATLLFRGGSSRMNIRKSENR
jgi:hypothetical protein